MSKNIAEFCEDLNDQQMRLMLGLSSINVVARAMQRAVDDGRTTIDEAKATLKAKLLELIDKLEAQRSEMRKEVEEW